MRVAVKHRAFFYVSLPTRMDPPHAGSHSPLRREALAMTPQRHRGRAAIASRSWREADVGSLTRQSSHANQPGAFVFAMIRLIYKGAWQPCLLYYSFSPCFHNGYLSAKQATASKGASSTFVIKKRHAAPVAAELLARHGAMG